MGAMKLGLGLLNDHAPAIVQFVDVGSPVLPRFILKANGTAFSCPQGDH